MIRASFLAAGLVLTQAASAADVDFAALVQRLPPALPADAGAALKTQTAALAASQTLTDDIQRAIQQVITEQANRVYAGTALAPGSDDPAQAQARMQAMAEKMQGMSQQQQIAMAMQMQQQVQSNMGVQAAAIAPSEQQAVITLAQDPQRSNQLMQSNTLLVQKVSAMKQAADAKHQQIQSSMDKALGVASAPMNHSDAECVAQSRKLKQIRVDALNQHVGVANDLLTQLQPVYTTYRQRAADELPHLNQDLALAAKIKTGAMQKQAAQTVSTARQATLAATQTGVEFYKQAFEESRWAGDRDRALAEPLATGCDGGGS